MKNSKWYDWLLIVAYIAMLVLCIVLNQFASYENIIVSATMFIVVAIIFISAIANSFIPMQNIITDLNEATAKIRNDAKDTKSYLWDTYKEKGVELFKTDMLKGLMQDWTFELSNDSDTKNICFTINIDRYINTGIVDRVMHRNELNQISGMLTGLGILGTFIGLSLGLQGFDMSDASDITYNIISLMDGIKVAFHTSIYGMVFSLTFNLVYKKKLFDAEESVENFVSTFKKYVLPDTEKDSTNMLIEMTGQQIVLLHQIQRTLAKQGVKTDEKKSMSTAQNLDGQKQNCSATPRSEIREGITTPKQPNQIVNSGVNMRKPVQNMSQQQRQRVE